MCTLASNKNDFIFKLDDFLILLTNLVSMLRPMRCNFFLHPYLLFSKLIGNPSVHIFGLLFQVFLVGLK